MFGKLFGRGGKGNQSGLGSKLSAPQGNAEGNSSQGNQGSSSQDSHNIAQGYPPNQKIFRDTSHDIADREYGYTVADYRRISESDARENQSESQQGH